MNNGSSSRKSRASSGDGPGFMTLETAPPQAPAPHSIKHDDVPHSKRLSYGCMMETNGASSLEQVDGFDSYVARNQGLFQSAAAPLASSSRSDGFALENVIGHDDRVAVGDTTKLPWRNIAMLSITYESGKRALGTAWFLGPKALGTAGHNICHPDFGRARQILVTPAYNGVVAPYGTWTASGTWCEPDWLNGDFSGALDYGVIMLASPDVGNRLGWFGFASYADSQLQNLLVNISGYVVDRAPHTQYFNGGRLEDGAREFLYYAFDTEGGMSGAPIFALFGNARVVIGIHTYGSDRINRARRIDDALYDVLARFK